MKIAFAGINGGSGCTTVASAVAIILASYGRQVLLADGSMSAVTRHHIPDSHPYERALGLVNRDVLPLVDRSEGDEAYLLKVAEMARLDFCRGVCMIADAGMSSAGLLAELARDGWNIILVGHASPAACLLLPDRIEPLVAAGVAEQTYILLNRINRTSDIEAAIERRLVRELGEWLLGAITSDIVFEEGLARLRHACLDIGHTLPIYPHSQWASSPRRENLTARIHNDSMDIRTNDRGGNGEGSMHGATDVTDEQNRNSPIPPQMSRGIADIVKLTNTICQRFCPDTDT